VGLEVRDDLPAASGIGAPNTRIILFTSLSHVAPGNGGCIVM
jgi:hypothetical protein